MHHAFQQHQRDGERCRTASADGAASARLLRCALCTVESTVNEHVRSALLARDGGRSLESTLREHFNAHNVEDFSTLPKILFDIAAARLLAAVDNAWEQLRDKLAEDPAALDDFAVADYSAEARQ